MKRIILSFDYELFFGDVSGTVQKTLIEPTNILLDSMDAVGFKGSFFVDWLMLKYINLEDDIHCKNDYLLIINQLKDIIRRGHRIELHIHPHWIDAKYKGDGFWDFSDFRNYSLPKLPQSYVTELIVNGKDYLELIAREVDPNYKIVAFRAGGWCVKPFVKLQEGFLKAGILIDSSVMPGVEITTDYSYCNFLSIKSPSKGYYSFTEEPDMPSAQGRFLEVPISSSKRSFISKIIGKISHIIRQDYSSLADGSHVRIKDGPDIWNVPSGSSVCTFSTINPLDGIIRLLLNTNDLVCYIDHPKDVSKYTAKSIMFLSKYCNSILYKDILDC